MLTSQQLQRFKQDGYLVVENIINVEELEYFRAIYEDFLNGKFETAGHRSDLSGQTEAGQQEKIVQIMRPSLLHPPLANSVIYHRVRQFACQLLGDDMDLDFDMMIDKPPYTNTPTPWHQDEAYWINMDDKRAVSCWLALDDVRQENGCMWFVPGSHKKELRLHRQTGKGGALVCDAREEEAIPAEIAAGSCTFHAGRTIHYARGNATNSRRRAYITNFRPAAMIAYERAQGFDHLGGRAVRQ